MDEKFNLQCAKFTSAPIRVLEVKLNGKVTSAPIGALEVNLMHGPTNGKETSAPIGALEVKRNAPLGRTDRPRE